MTDSPPEDKRAVEANQGSRPYSPGLEGVIAGETKLGYVDLSDAKASGLKYASIKNQAGKYVEPTADAASAAGDGIEIKDNLLFSALNAKGDKSYPITCQTWVIVYAKQTDAAKGAFLKHPQKFCLQAQFQLANLIEE